MPATPRRLVPPLLAAVLALAGNAPARAAAKPGAEFTSFVQKPFTGDLDAMLARRMVRILVVPSQTGYFVDKGTQRGVSYDIGKDFEDELNKKRKKGEGRVEVVFVPVHRDKLLTGLVNGQGDIGIANLTITPERLQFVDFSAPFLTGVDEIVVSGPASPEVKSLDDLSGKTIFVRPTSSYFQSLWHLNEALSKKGKPGVVIEQAPEEMEDEDILQMLNAGLTELAVVDNHKAEFWAQILPSLRLHPDIAVRKDGEVAWAFRKNSPQLAGAVNAFMKTHAKGTAFGNQKLKEYFKNLKYVKSANSAEERKKLLEMIAIFRKYADQYDFDWLMVAAQGYQESRLDQSVKSRVGAIGVMQVMPSTGKELKVGDIHQRDANIHAGTKYLRQVIDQNFNDPAIDPMNRTLFAFASYNAGPARVVGLRKKAAKEGLDPNVWFGNVEQVTATEVGQEPVRYVANIYKYYVAYKLVAQTESERKNANQKAGETR
jgi:membrane-bound lytic murein transglycosylase MltF